MGRDNTITFLLMSPFNEEYHQLSQAETNLFFDFNHYLITQIQLINSFATTQFASLIY